MSRAPSQTQLNEPRTLRDGSEVVIRRITPEDAPVLAEAFARLSRESRELRFLGAKPHLTARELRYLTAVDGSVHEALGAVEASSGRGVGVARFIRLAPRSEVAEVAVTVIDEWQRRGLGTILLEELTERARAQGIRRYTALVSDENNAVLALLDAIDAHVEQANPESGTLAYEIELSPSGLGHSLGGALRAAASGRLALPAGIAEALHALLAGHRPGARGRPTAPGGLGEPDPATDARER